MQPGLINTLEFTYRHWFWALLIVNRSIWDQLCDKGSSQKNKRWHEVISLSIFQCVTWESGRWSTVCVNISWSAELVPCDQWNRQTSLTSVQLKPTQPREAPLVYTPHLHLCHTAEEEPSLEHLSRTPTSTPHTSTHHTNDPPDRALAPDLAHTGKHKSLSFHFTSN